MALDLEALQAAILRESSVTWHEPPFPAFLHQFPSLRSTDEVYFSSKSLFPTSTWICQLLLQALGPDVVLVRLRCIVGEPKRAGLEESDFSEKTLLFNADSQYFWRLVDQTDSNPPLSVEMLDSTYYLNVRNERNPAGQVVGWMRTLGLRPLAEGTAVKIADRSKCPHPNLSFTSTSFKFSMKVPFPILTTAHFAFSRHPAQPSLLHLTLKLSSPLALFPHRPRNLHPLLGSFNSLGNKLIYQTKAVLESFDPHSVVSYTVDNLLAYVESMYLPAFSIPGLGSAWVMSKPKASSDKAMTESTGSIKPLIAVEETPSEGLWTFDCDVNVDSSRERIILKFRWTEDLYWPDIDTKDCFMGEMREENGDKVVEVEIEDWGKIYKDALVGSKQISAFFLQLLRLGLAFDQIPWNCVYIHKRHCGDSDKIRLVPRFKRICVRQREAWQDEETKYWNRVMQSWVDLQKTKEERRRLLGNPGFDGNIDIQLLPIKSFEDPVLDSKGRLLGKGGFGIVFHNRFGAEDVAVKIPNPAKEQKPKKVMQEIKIMSQLSHPNIVRFYGVVQYHDHPVLVLERCEELLSNQIRKTQNLPASQQLSLKSTLRLLREIADAIAYLHREDICHFDLKPSNIMLKISSNGAIEPKISDFGMASGRTEDGKWGNPGFTLGYSAPEQLQSYQLGPHCDVWSFAMIAYYMLCRKAPYDYLNIQGERNPRKRMFIKEQCVKLRKPLVPVELAQSHPQLVYLLRQCWHSNPTSRPTMSAVLKEVQRLEELE